VTLARSIAELANQQLQRATLIEINLFQLQGRLAMKQKLEGQSKSDTARSGLGYRLLRSPDSLVPSQSGSNTNL
jgi:hypothetical protein